MDGSSRLGWPVLKTAGWVLDVTLAAADEFADGEALDNDGKHHRRIGDGQDNVAVFAGRQ